MIERIRRNDYLYGFWLTKGGNFFWLIRRDEQLIFQAVIGMIRHIHIVVPYESDAQIPMVTEMMKQLFCVAGNGEEIVCHNEWNIAEKGLGKILADQFLIFDETQKQIKAEQKKTAKELKEPETIPEGEIDRAFEEKPTPLIGKIRHFRGK